MARFIELAKFFDAELFEELEKITSLRKSSEKLLIFLGTAMKGSKGQCIPFSETLGLFLRVRYRGWG